MKQLDIIEQEIAELEKSQRENDKQLKLLRKSRASALKRQEEDKKVKGLKEIDDLVNTANDELSDTSLFFEKDDILGSILVKLGDDYLETNISFEDLNFKKISGFVNAFVRNAKTVKKRSILLSMIRQITCLFDKASLLTTIYHLQSMAELMIFISRLKVTTTC